MSVGWATWWRGKSDYVTHLEGLVATLQGQLTEKDRRIDELMERLLLKAEVPPTPQKKIEIDRAMMQVNEELRDQQFGIWDDLDGGDDDDDKKATNEVMELVTDAVGRDR